MSNTAVSVPDINTQEGLEELGEKLEGVQLLKEKYLNAPADLQTAVERIMELEMRLEDLARAAEIAEITQNVGMIEGFRRDAEAALANKITIDRPVPQDKMKITILTNGKETA